MKDLHFLNPAVPLGFSTTVRDGMEWKDVRPGDLVRVKRTGHHEVLCHAVVVASVTLDSRSPSQCAVLGRWCEMEHDPACRTLEGLDAAMDRRYGARKWGPLVTVLVLYRSGDA